MVDQGKFVPVSVDLGTLRPAMLAAAQRDQTAALEALARTALAHAAEGVELATVRQQLTKLKMTLVGDQADRLERILAEDADKRATAALRSSALSQSRENRTDPVLLMHARGTIDERALKAAREIRIVLAQLEGWAGVGAIDPTMLRVDGGRGWTERLFQGAGAHRQTEKVRAWAREIETTPGVQGRRGTLTGLAVCLRVVAQLTSINSLERELGCRAGTVGPVVATALNRYI